MCLAVSSILDDTWARFRAHARAARLRWSRVGACWRLVSLLAAGCGSGCDGERIRPPGTPHIPVVVPGDAASSGSGSDDGDPSLEIGSGFLDAPPGALDHLYAALDAAETAAPSGRVLLVFFGDSHTAGDSMTSRVRVTWQQRFGDAGRGLVAAGRPTARHYYQRDVRYGASGVWKSSVGGVRDPEPYGIAGLRVYGDKKGAQLWVESCAECRAGTRVAQFEILYQASPSSGSLRYRIDDGSWQLLATKTAAIEPPHPARHVIAVPDGPHRLTLEHQGGGVVDLYALGVVLYEMVTGTPPFGGPALGDLLVQHLTATPVPPRELVMETPVVLDALIVTLLAKPRAERIASSAEVGEILRCVRDGDPLDRAIARPRRAVPPRRRTTQRMNLFEAIDSAARRERALVRAVDSTPAVRGLWLAVFVVVVAAIAFAVVFAL